MFEACVNVECPVFSGYLNKPKQHLPSVIPCCAGSCTGETERSCKVRGYSRLSYQCGAS